MNNLKTGLINEATVGELIDRAFEEDIKNGDVTTNAIIDETTQVEAAWQVKQQGIIAGLDVAEAVFLKLDPALSWEPCVSDGDEAEEGDIIVKMHGSCRAVLTAERTALNIAQRMSGIATKTHRFVKAVDGYSTQILDTRKTVPGLRMLDKYAVACGGGRNHRMGLFDLALIKDNHIVAAGGIIPAVNLIRKQNTEIKIEVETTNLNEVQEALSVKADIIMLDNMSPALMKKAVIRINGRAETEASGNITLKDIKQVAETGVDYISVGALTHSVTAFDISQLIMG